MAPKQQQPHQHRQPAHVRPYRIIITAFLAWKLLLFAITLGSFLVGEAYDTSAGLVVRRPDSSSSRDGVSRLITRLSSWDAIYFVSIARRGCRFEQDWAFCSGFPVAWIAFFLLPCPTCLFRSFPTLTSTVVIQWLPGLEYFGIVGSSASEGGALPEALAGIFIANGAHLLSALALYRLGQVVWRDQTLSLVAALLHIISPAGLFLSAPYAESSFALLSFTGYLLFALSCRAEQRPWCRDLYTVSAGILFGLATAFRSNGILNGIPFAWEVLRHLPRLSQRPTDTLRRLLALGVGGVFVAAGSLGPQAVAYLRFCSGTSGAPPRPWCQGYLPSIYTFVQQHYWNVGFLRYWTVSNIPLFLLAAPMLTVLLKSGVDQLSDRRLPAADKPAESARLLSVVQSAAVAQVLLAVLALTSYHVQIITRISSGYPLWYWWVAGSVVRGEKTGSRIVMFMVIYAAIQGALFTSFLPPA